MTLTDKQLRVYEWLNDCLKLPVLADAYKGAATLLIQKSPGYVSFVAHAGRDIINRLASEIQGIRSNQVQYVHLVNSLQEKWKDEWRYSDNLSPEGVESGHLIPGKVCQEIYEMIEEHKSGRERSLNADALFFSTFLDYKKDEIPNNFILEWKKAKKFFNGHAHLRKESFCAEIDGSLERHFKCLDSYLYIAASSQFERLKDLNGILDAQPTNEMIEKALSSIKKETDRQYFFSKLKDPLWVEPLRKRNYFSDPPGVKSLPDGYMQYPHWPELAYLANIAEESGNEVVDIVLSIPDTDNPSVHEDILTIALKLNGPKSAKLLPKLIEYTNIKRQFLSHRYSVLLEHWINQGNTDEALKLVENLVPFIDDPRSQEKQQLRRKNPNSVGIQLEPSPRFHEWEYQQILEKGVAPLVENKPYQVACILIDTVASMIKMSMHQRDLDKGRDEDYSEIWCRRLDKADSNYKGNYKAVNESLVNTLTYACEKVYDKAPESIDDLNNSLKTQQWKVFQRLRQYLYASNPNEKTLPWIRELILDHKDYSRRNHHYEFQIMVRRACEHFGPELLSEGEKTSIFNAILNGPPKEDFHGLVEEEHNDKDFQMHQRYFHHVQLRPFATLLSENVKYYFKELEGDAEAKEIDDESYSPYSNIRSGTISYRSPKPAEEIEGFTDEELLNYLNDWDDEHRDEDNFSVEINISALAGVFQSLFIEKIAQNPSRLDFWMANCNKIARPIYVSTMVKAMLEIIKGNNFKQLDRWIEFCDWVLSHPDSERIEGEPEPRDESHEYPDWGSSRRVVVDFIDACVNKNLEVTTAREGLASLLRQVCTQFDWRLDRDQPVILNHNNPIDEAINNTRSRAIESLVNFGLWIRRQLPEDPVSEVTDVLSIRLGENAVIQLTRPEQALLGMHFLNLCSLNRKWAVDQQNILFPQINISIWRDTFSSYILYNKPVKVMFGILRGDFEYAINNLAVLNSAEECGKEYGRDFVDGLGEHLFIYYLWHTYSLTGEDSLLARFYDQTKDNRERWATLFDNAGRLLMNSGKHLDNALVERAIAFFDWRFQAVEARELKGFTFWLEADCLDPKWRLISYSKILDLEGWKKVGLPLGVKTLNRLCPKYLTLVVECFKKITDLMDQSTQMYIAYNEASSILAAGLGAKDPQVQDNAKCAREKLLQLGRFDFLDVAD